MLLVLLMVLSQLTTFQLETRLLAGRLAWHDLLVFAQLNTPDPTQDWNAEKSKFTWTRFHRLIADHLQAVESGRIQFLEIETPPRVGKSELAVRNFVPWCAGKHPTEDVIVVTATHELAQQHGRDCRDYFRGAGYQLTFGENPGCKLREDSQSSDFLQLAGGGKIHFYGRGGIPAGVGAHRMIFDDFFKSAEEAYSTVEREKAWRCFVADCQSRLNSSKASIIEIGSRKHEDDVQGRQFDPTNIHYDNQEAKKWTRIRLPALAESSDALGRKIDEPLWPERFPFEFYNAKRNHKSPVVRIDFQTQDQCKPLPEEGNYFKKNWLPTYKLQDLPKQLRKYASSDHALRKGQANDSSCLLSVGIDVVGRIFILPDTVWDKIQTDVMVEKMIDLMAANQTQMWWAARDQISGSIEPFLKKRMRERGVYRPFDDSISEGTDLMQRARSIQARMAMGMVLWPEEWPQWGEAHAQLLAFPNGKKDDLIAALAMLGMGLDRMLPAEGAQPPGAGMPKPGTLAWVKSESQRTEIEQRAVEANKGW